MWAYIVRRLLYAIPVYLGIVFVMMAALRVNDPVAAYLGKNASPEQIAVKRRAMGLDRPFLPVGRYDPDRSVAPLWAITWERAGVDGWRTTGIGIYHPLDSQYIDFVRRIVTLDFGTPERPYESWRFAGQNVGQKLREAIGPTLAITIPDVVLTTIVGIGVGMLAAYARGRWLDRLLMVGVVLGMSISVVVFVVLGQYFGAYWLREQLGREIFATGGYEPIVSWQEVPLPGGGSLRLPVPSVRTWVHYCALPVLIGVVVAVGYDARFYRAVIVEETTKDYVTTAMAKGAGKTKVMLVHVGKNAMIPIVTRIMITIPFLIGGSIVLEYYFRIPGMGKMLIDALTNKDFPIVQTFTAIFAAMFLISNILTDILYALVDPRVRLS